MSEEQTGIKSKEDFLKLLLKVEAKDVNLKFIFDHITNYGICGLMLGVGARVFGQSDSGHVFRVFFDMLAGGLLFALGWGLFALNFVHAILAFFRLRDAKEVNRYWYLVTCFLLFLVASRLMIYALKH
jgi:hypothetical protein